MIEPYKQCPYCGQPAVLSMPRCGRCGAPYPPLPTESAPQRRSGPIIALLALCSLVALIALIVFAFQRTRSSAHAFAGNSLTTSHSQVAPSGPPVTGANGHREPGSLFTERAGRSATPTI